MKILRNTSISSDVSHSHTFSCDMEYEGEKHNF